VFDFLPQSDPLLAYVCDYFLNDAPLYFYPTLEDRSRGTEAEEEFAEQRLARRDEQIAVARTVPAGELPSCLVIKFGEAPLYPGNQHSELVARAPDNSAWTNANIASLSIDGFDAVVLCHAGISYDLTAITGTAAALAQNPGMKAAILAAWRYMHGSILLLGRPADAESIAQFRQTNDDEAFIVEVLPRIVWTAEGFRSFQAELLERADSPLAQCLADWLAREPCLAIEKPRMMIG